MPAASYMTYDDVKLCNCANPACGRELLGESMLDSITKFSSELRRLLRFVGKVEGRIAGRPYCRTCYRAKTYVLRAS